MLLRTVLIVEDAEDCATTLEIAFHAIPNLAVRLVSSADEALEMFEREGGLISALVTDLNLPRMDGWDLIAGVRRRDDSLPIIVVSGDTDPRTPERARRAGADAYFAKPFSPAQVRQKLEQLLNASIASS